MSEGITSVGIDAHKRELHVAMRIGSAATPVTWTVGNEPRRLPDSTGSSNAKRPGRCGWLRGGAVRLCAATASEGRRDVLRRHRAGVDATETGDRVN